VNSPTHEPDFGHPAEAFLTELPGFGQVVQVLLGANSWAMFNWTIPSQEAETFWWAVVEAPDPQNVSLAVVALNPEDGLQTTGELLSTPSFYTTDPDEAPELASRSAFKPGIQSLHFGRPSGSRPTVLVAVDSPFQQEVLVTLIPNRSSLAQGDIPDDVRQALDHIDANKTARISDAKRDAGVSLQRYHESWVASSGEVRMQREWWPEGVSQQPVAANVPAPAIYSTTSIRMAYGARAGFVLFSASVTPDSSVAASVVGQGTVLGHSLDTSRGHIGGQTCLAVECIAPFRAYGATVHDAGQGETNYALDIGFKGVLTDSIYVQSQLIYIAADVEGFTGQQYPTFAEDAYFELL
jgi:hypothetical protein